MNKPAAAYGEPMGQLAVKRLRPLRRMPEIASLFAHS